VPLPTSQHLIRSAGFEAEANSGGFCDIYAGAWRTSHTFGWLERNTYNSDGGAYGDLFGYVIDLATNATAVCCEMLMSGS
jgi:hypothetical protein